MYESLFRNVVFPVYETWIKRRNIVSDLARLGEAAVAHAGAVAPDPARAAQRAARARVGRGAVPTHVLGRPRRARRRPARRRRTRRVSGAGQAPDPRELRGHDRAGANERVRSRRPPAARRPSPCACAIRWPATRRAMPGCGAAIAGRARTWGRRTLYLWGVLPGQGRLHEWRDRAFHAVYNRRMLDTFHLRQDSVRDYVARINAYRPRTIIAYVHGRWSCSRRRSADQGLTVWHPENILTGAEALGRIAAGAGRIGVRRAGLQHVRHARDRPHRRGMQREDGPARQHRRTGGGNRRRRQPRGRRQPRQRADHRPDQLRDALRALIASATWRPAPRPLVLAAAACPCWRRCTAASST